MFVNISISVHFDSVVLCCVVLCLAMTFEIFVPTTKRKYKFNLVEIANFIVLKSLSNLEGGGGGGGGFEEYSVETQYPDM